MGAGAWSASTYARSTGSKIASGTSFGYTKSMASAPRGTRVAHDSLNPKKVAGAGSPLAGQIVRESRDNDEHPTSLPIVLGFDETGSMGEVPVLLQKKLAEVHGLLTRKGYVEHPQILIGAYGDAQNYEDAPLQVAQFESDNKADEDLDNIFIERNGGGNGGESAALFWYYFGKHTSKESLDSLGKRGKKGYLFTIGDEVPLTVTREEVKTYLGYEPDFEGSLTPKQAAEMAQKNFEVFHIIINNNSAHYQHSSKVYNDILGKNAILLENEENVAETIASIIGVNEGMVDLDDALDNLDEIGAGAARGDVGKALANFSGGTAKGSVVKATAPVDVVSSKPASRL